ncbi:MarR family transcriptional regulator [Sediminicoccus sp. KRV36]|uniref:MarR family winged helix-turn-helix transcriptional regulator n=1 Tax=Sediminicoccus sp. KRV36 TaxID=3133721 RepID=UPI00200DA78C|nr:MarR family transcriptional regulator [Sediminicoccus rosea]UPY37402.1 MarR family winged helix-turn-helix transcriptional regulator [Sediminicoccus rosea]
MTANPAPLLPDLHRGVPQHLARRFAQICNAFQAELYQPLDLMPVHVALLAQIRATPGMDRNWLAAATGHDATSAGQALEAFVRRGLVARGIQPKDRRAGAFTLTPQGEALSDTLREHTRAAARRILAPLSPAEGQTLLGLLARLIEAHEAHARPGAGRKPPRRKPKAHEESLPCKPASPAAAASSSPPRSAAPAPRPGRNARSG